MFNILSQSDLRTVITVLFLSYFMLEYMYKYLYFTKAD